MNKTRTFIFAALAMGIMTMTANTAALQTAPVASAADDNTTADSTKGANAAEEPVSIADEVIWVVGDEAILLSDVEMLRAQMEMEGQKIEGNPDCVLPEQIAVQKLFLHQAALDSIEVTEAEVAQDVERQISYWISMIGSKEKLEEYRKMSMTQIRQSLHDDFKNNKLTERMREKLVGDIKVSPSEVRQYFKNMPEDSIPFVPTEVEVEIITRTPRVAQEEINRIKDELRSYTDRVTNGETSFASLARLYSEDGSARNGGELDYMGRGMLDPAFAAVAFNLTDPKKVSKIVESEFGYHIIQLVDKRGDKIKCRHILRKPRITQEAIDEGIHALDSLVTEMKNGKFTFEEAATYVSDDKDTRSNNGLMANTDNETQTRTSKFRMQDLPTEVARAVEQLKVGEVSPAFQMVNSRGKTVCAVIKLKSRVDSHRATITEDFQIMKNVVLAKQRQEFIKEWVKNKIKNTYVRMKDRYKSCKFEYEGWVQD